jgi:hypothetical protein
MPKNNQQLIVSYQDFAAKDAVTLSPQSTGVRLRQIPAGTLGAPLGTVVYLPPAVSSGGSDDPSDGDQYTIVDSDGSCNGTAPIIIVPPAGTTIALATETALFTTGISATVTYDAENENWDLVLGGQFAEAAGGFGTFNGQVTPGNITPNIAGAVLWATGPLTPKVSGLYQVNATFGYECAAGDTVQLELRTYGDVVSTTGGQFVNGGALFYETVALGSPAVAAGSGPTVKATYDQTIVAAKQGIITISALVQAPATPETLPNTGLEQIAIDCFLSTLANGSALTVLRLDVSISEVI